MAISKKAALAEKIKHLELSLMPLVPLPDGPPHPAFPRTMLAYHLLTEEELDSIAHHYHQSTPGYWTNQYPACMNWNKEHLKRPSNTERARRQSSSDANNEWLSVLLDETEQIMLSPKPQIQNKSRTRRWSLNLSDRDRVAVKRRKVGKFIGLRGMDTPVAEIEGRIQASWERALNAAREDFKRMEEYDMARGKH